jgi:glycosyltransferase involved in cell wall biosynthesis
LKAEAASKLNNIDYSFMGQVSNKEVVSYYKNNHVDLFINVSESEGIPVSIMEVISFGIPVVATDVGGTSEIVEDGYNGLLITKDFSEEELTEIFVDAITGKININSYREGARKVWIDKYSCEKNYNEFYKKMN